MESLRARGIHLAMICSGASLPSPSHARSCRKRHEEAARNYGKDEANVNGGVDVLHCFRWRVCAEAGPQAATSEGGSADKS